jgi:hypothetical protein
MIARIVPVVVALVLLAGPLAAQTQPAKRVYRVGMLMPGAPPEPSDRVTLSVLIPTALRELGSSRGRGRRSSRWSSPRCTSWSST